MSQKEEQIQYRLKILSQIEPSPEATQRAVQNVRDTLTNTKQEHDSIGAKIIRMVSNGHTLKFAATAMLLIAIGFIAGRFFSPEQDIESLQASLVPAVTQNVLAQINEQWQKEYARNYVQIKDELSRQMSQEAARIKDRQWTAAALEKIELNRRQDNARIGSLVTHAARTN
jgi:hypothetical protein